jgi:protein O-GlcNAc transferase
MSMENETIHEPVDVAVEFQKALQFHQAGQLQMAEAIYRQILEVNPKHSDALHLLGVISYQVGRYDIAINLISEAIKYNPSVPSYHNNIGGAFKFQGRLEESISSYLKAIELKPDYADAYNNLGVVFKEQGRIEESILSHQKAIQLKPDYAEAYYNLGIALQSQGKPEEALSSYQKAIQLKPGFAEANNSLGILLQSQGKPEEAVSSYQKAVQLKPDFAEAYNNLGNALQDLGKSKESTLSCQKAIQLKPDYAEAYYNLGIALQSQGKPEEALSSYEKAIQLKPDFTEAYNNLGNALQDQGKPEEAVSFYQKAIQIKADYTEAYNNLGIALKEQGKIEESIPFFQRAFSLKPENSDAHSNYLMALHYIEKFDKEALHREALEWGRIHSSLLYDGKSFINATDPDRRIKVGYVSPDFRKHPIGFFIEAVLTCHDREHFEVYCYSNDYEQDEMTHKLQALPIHWRSIAGVSDELAQKMIIDDGVDILIDLSGHSAKHRLLLFAKKPAPVQATWIGYFDTTGMDAMDYIIADKYIIPEEDETYYVEKIARLPDCYLCYTPHFYALEVNELPLLSRGYITFGCFNNIAKINPAVVAVWSEILKAVPDSKLCLGTHSFISSPIRNEYMEQFARNGVESDRIVFLGKTPHHEYLANYGNIDIVLDSFPFTGNTTTMDALWMGVPVPTFVRDNFVGRLGFSILSTLGLNELIAFSKDEYIDKVLGLAADIEGLSALRRSLRDRLRTSPLCDSIKFTAHLEILYRNMWVDWGRKQIVG